MGVVWLARDEHLHEDVALKFLPPEIRHDAVALDDLRRETSRSRKLTHPHIIRIHDLYKADNEAFISMEFVDGSNLAELRLQQTDRVFKWTFIEPLIKQLCDALQYAHGEHVIHRDLKPANMMLDARGRLKLADFGLAATVSDSLSRVSMGKHAFSGTASYMSPQQLDGQLPQVTDDIYSLGSTLYELLTSRAPFFTGDIAHQVRSLPPQPVEKRLAQLRIENPIPTHVTATIMACLAKEPDKRPQSARAVAEQMGLVSGQNGDRSVQPVEVSTDSQRSAVAMLKPATETLAPVPEVRVARKSRWPLISGVALIVALAITAALWRWSHHRPLNKAVAQQSATNTVRQTPPPSPPASELISLFNGHDLSEWDGDRHFWSAQDGAITATGATSQERRPEAIFWRGGPVEDFELRLSFKIESGNSGIYYRAQRIGAYEVGGYQLEIAGDRSGILLETGSDRIRREPSHRGFVTVATMIDGKSTVTNEKPIASPGVFKRDGWNDVVIIARGNQLTHMLNGRMVMETRDEYEKRPRSGMIALEVYGRDPTTVKFRDIRLKRLPPAEPGNAPSQK